MKPAFSPCVWRAPTDSFDLEPGQLDVWIADLDVGEGARDAYRRLLSERETARVERLQVATVADRYVVSRGILRLLLSRYSGLAPQSLAFRYGPLGKPSLEPLPDGRVLSFNNTDCGGIAIYAFALDREIGVDLECTPREVRAERISRRRFMSAEADAIASAPEPDTAFLACWTRKEAWGKAIGLGIRYPMNAIDLCSDIETPWLAITPEMAESGGQNTPSTLWKLVQLRPLEDALASVVAAGEDWTVRGWRYNPPPEYR